MLSIILVPMIFVIFFYDRHWDTVTAIWHKSAGEIALLVSDVNYR